MKKSLRIITLFLGFLCCSGVLAFGIGSSTPPPPITYNVEGVSGSELDNVNSRLKILQSSFGQDVSADDVATFNKNAPLEIQKALEPFGYFNPDIQVTRTTRDKGWKFSYQIQPGPAVKVKSIHITLVGEGKNNPALEALVKTVPIKPGDNFNSNAYNSIKSKLLSTAISEGFLDANLTEHQVEINISQQTADETLVLNTGAQYYFGHIQFSKTPFQSRFLQRFVPFKIGDRYTSAQLLQLQQNLMGSGYFSIVNIKPLISQAKNHVVPLDIELTMQKKIQYTIGAGYGTDTGPRATLGFNWRWLNSMGENFKALITVSGIENDITGKYIIPGKNPLTQQYFISGLVGQESPPNNSNGNLQRLTGGYTTVLGGWTQSISLNAQHEYYNLDGGPYQTSYLVYPRFNWSRSSYDNLVFPLHGGSISLNVIGAAKQLLSNATFLQTELKGQYIFSLTPANRFVARGDLGYTLINDLSNLPLSLQFYAGGAVSMRGYGYEDLGPGKELAVGSLEYQREIYKKVYATVFYDAGNAADHVFYCTAQDGQTGANCGIQRSPGVGAMWASPVGPLELTLAKATTEPGDWKENWHVEFTMGTSL